MTHSLYRKGTIADLKNDYVIISMLARGFNDKSPEVKKNHLRLGEILKQHNPTNLLMEGAWNVSTVIQGCFSDIRDIKEILQTVKDEDLGVSVVVSGLVSEVKNVCDEVGLKMHTVNLALGEFGKKELLPSEKTLEITTMCGHHCVSSQSIEHYVDQIKKGKISLEKAAEKLTSPCICGIFNIKRAMQVLNDLIN